jgi:hypothetical protein
MTSSGTAGLRSSALEDLHPSQVVFSGRLGRCEKLTSFRGRRRKIFSPDSYAAGAGGRRNELDETLDAYQQNQDNRDQPVHRDQNYQTAPIILSAVRPAGRIEPNGSTRPDDNARFPRV